MPVNFSANVLSSLLAAHQFLSTLPPRLRWQGQRTGPQVDHLLRALSHQGIGLALGCSGSTATRRTNRCIGSAEPHAHERVLLGPRVFHGVTPGTGRADLMKQQGNQRAIIRASTAPVGAKMPRNCHGLARARCGGKCLTPAVPHDTPIYPGAGVTRTVAGKAHGRLALGFAVWKLPAKLPATHRPQE